MRKSNSTYRPVIEFRQLNKVTVFDAEPMPNSETILAEEGQDRYVSKLNLSKGYWQLPLRQEDREKTAVFTRHWLFQFRVIPFGLVTAGASYSSMMIMLLDGMDCVVNYVEDVSIHTMTWEEHLTTLLTLFVQVRGSGLTVKPTTCYLGFVSVEFLGHQVGCGEVKTQEE